MRILKKTIRGLRVNGLESTSHLVGILFYPHIQVYPEPCTQRQLPTKWGNTDGFVLKSVCLLVDNWAFITVWQGIETHIVISRDL